MKTNFKIAFRSIKKSKVHSLISIVGLGIGLGCIMLLSVLYIHDTSFDRFIPQYENVYRVIRGEKSLIAFPLGDLLKEENPMVEDFFRYHQKSEIEIKKTPKEIIQDENFGFADASFFDVLGIKMKTGIAAQNKTELAISEKMAMKYFPGQSAIGKILQIRINEDFLPLTICGVYHDFPSNSTLSPQFVANIDLSGEALGFNQKMFGTYNSDSEQFKNWDRSSFYTYIRLLPGSNRETLTRDLAKYQNFTTDEKRKDLVFSLQSVKDIYLKSDGLVDSYFSKRGDAKDLKYYLAIASLILLIAVTNYIFLNKAKTESKLKEIGSQKALGASCALLRKQMILESTLVAFISLLPAIAVIALGIPFVNNALNQSIDLQVFLLWRTWFVLVGIVLLTGICSGLIISGGILRISSVLLLKGKKTSTPKISIWHNAILSVHFSIFIILITSVVVLNKQLKFALANFKGINPENVLVYELNSDVLSKQFSVIKNEVDKIPGVVMSAGSSFVPPFNDFLPLRINDETGKEARFDGLIMGQGMIELLGINLLEGETFGEFSTNETNIIFNESAAKQYNLKAGDLFSGCRVRGIVKDFNAHSMHRLIQPMAIIQQHPEKMRLFVVKTNGINNVDITKAVTNIIRKILPNKTTTSYLLTDQINKFYINEQNQAQLVSAFSLLAITLSVMGLLGMTLITIIRKTKEIGIRKVNGARISEVMTMLNKDFVKWVAIAFVIATPIAYFAMDKWLENFAYKTTLSWWIFALAGVLALGIALLTVSLQSWKAATRNPVEALRYE